MRRQAFVPARNSRHRQAALALYRALLRSVVESPHIKDTETRQRATDTVRRRFRGNASYDSSRLVFAAMTAGYKVTLSLYLC